MKLRKLMVAALLFFAGLAQAQQQQMMPTLPVDPDVRIGKLDNGLTYYIRHNNWPENRANFYIAQKVGSIQEEEAQRGLAHFLEHMCFNGTKHFPGNGVIRFCESIGVQFGRDLNAYTSIDQTVYNISNVPTTRQSALDSCLLILSDWADLLRYVEVGTVLRPCVMADVVGQTIVKFTNSHVRIGRNWWHLLCLSKSCKYCEDCH